MKLRLSPLSALSLKLTFAVVGAWGASGCGSDKAAQEPVAAAVESDEAKLAERIDTTQADVPLVEGAELNIALLDTFTALQVASVTPPTVGGLTVQANDVSVFGLSTYIGYNYAGEPYAGAIDVLDVTNVLALKILSSYSLPNTDINGLERSGTNLYAVGASSATNGAFLERIALNGSLPTGTVTRVALPSFAGTDITLSSDKIYTTSGDGGGLNVFDLATMTQTLATPIVDARAVGLSSTGTPMVLSGKPGTVNVMTSTGALASTIPLGGANTAQSKSTLTIGSKWSVASLGEGGFKVFCNATGAQILQVPQVVLSGVDPSKTVTNAVTAANGLIFTANGEAGVYVYALRNTSILGTCGTGSVSLLGTLNFGSGFSANSVYSNGPLLFVTTGLGGLRILTTTFTTLSPLSTSLL